MKRTVILFFLILSMSSLITASFAQTEYSLDFYITLDTDKTIYHPGELVNVTGVVFYNGSLIFELVAVQVNDINDSMAFRTVYSWPPSGPPTIPGDINGDGYVDIFDAVKVAAAFGAHAGDPNYDLGADIDKNGLVDIFDMVVVAGHFGQGHPPMVWRIEVIDAYIGDLYGNPVGTVRNGSDYYVHVHYKNTQPVPIFALIAFSIYDANDVPIFASYLIYGVVAPGPSSASLRWRVPADATLGTAKIYASAYSDYPQAGGYPFSLEKSSAFNIQQQSGFSMAQNDFTTTEVTGHYGLTFCIPTKGTKIGTYSIYATSFHFTGQIALITSNSTTFQVQP